MLFPSSIPPTLPSANSFFLCLSLSIRHHVCMYHMYYYYYHDCCCCYYHYHHHWGGGVDCLFTHSCANVRMCVSGCMEYVRCVHASNIVNIFETLQIKFIEWNRWEIPMKPKGKKALEENGEERWMENRRICSAVWQIMWPVIGSFAFYALIYSYSLVRPLACLLCSIIYTYCSAANCVIMFKCNCRMRK